MIICPWLETSFGPCLCASACVAESASDNTILEMPKLFIIIFLGKLHIINIFFLDTMLYSLSCIWHMPRLRWARTSCITYFTLARSKGVCLRPNLHYINAPVYYLFPALSDFKIWTHLSRFDTTASVGTGVIGLKSWQIAVLSSAATLQLAVVLCSKG
jgi:hypothetical protein